MRKARPIENQFELNIWAKIFFSPSSSRSTNIPEDILNIILVYLYVQIFFYLFIFNFYHFFWKNLELFSILKKENNWNFILFLYIKKNFILKLNK